MAESMKLDSVWCDPWANDRLVLFLQNYFFDNGLTSTGLCSGGLLIWHTKSQLIKSLSLVSLSSARIIKLS